MKKLNRITAIIISFGLFSGIVAGCVAKPPASYDSTEKIANQAVEEFLAFTKIPRSSRQTEKALAYLQNFAATNGLEHFRDEYGNFWMDIPATKGYEDYPKVILQGHMDMVCVAAPGKDIDFATTGITAVVKDNTVMAEGTSLGADNGIGVGIMLAIAQSKVAHGPLRALITTDEDIGLLGAAALPPETLDAEYLINVDFETANQICYSSAGNLRAVTKKQCEVADISPEKKIYQLRVTGLMGGHSGLDIDKGRLSAGVALIELLDAIQEAGLPLSLAEIQSGTAINAITQDSMATFAISATDETNMQQAVEGAKQALGERFPLEKMECVLEPIESSSLGTISVEESADLIALVRSLPQGVISMSPKKEGVVQTSFNIGIIKLENGAVEIGTSSRSSVTADVNQIEADSKATAEEYGYEYVVSVKYPGYDGDPNSPLLKLTENAYTSMNIKAEPVAIHAGLECSWFASLREGIQMVCVGPTVENAHTTNETLYIDTVQPVIQAVLYCLEHINEI